MGEARAARVGASHDVSGNLLNVTLPDGRFIEYVTDGRHRRIAKKVNGVIVRRWVYQDQLNPIAELDGTGALLYRYAYGSMAHSPDFVVNASGETYRVIRDQLGSPLLVVNIHDEDDVLLEVRYTAFGQRTVLDGDGAALTLGFAGGIYDEDTGLTRFGVRDYDPLVGRWTSKDPVAYTGTELNLYVYSFNNPVYYMDPEGEEARPFNECMDDMGVGWAISAMALGAPAAPILPKTAFEIGRTARFGEIARFTNLVSRALLNLPPWVKGILGIQNAARIRSVARTPLVARASAAALVGGFAYAGTSTLLCTAESAGGGFE